MCFYINALRYKYASIYLITYTMNMLQKHETQFWVSGSHVLSVDVWLKPFLAEPQFFFTVTSPYCQPPPLEYPFLAQMALLWAGLLVVLFVVAVAAREGCEAEDEALLQVPCNRKNRRSNLVGLFHFGWILCFLHKGRVSNTCM